ncbi:MAG: helix-turn-helix transcriptional regulator, partial [Oscillospiraceae bacterium]|nr:helix-turn-helix transcriptional regulator [Oscillospiraceae bacterium]
MNILAENISRRRKELKMTQKQLAEKLNISDKTVSRWETGAQIPDGLIIPDIA